MKTLKYIGGGLCAVLLLWTLISWVDIVVDNCELNPQHSKYNIFVLMTK